MTMEEPMSAEMFKRIVAHAGTTELESMLTELHMRVAPLAIAPEVTLAADVYRTRRLRDACFGADADVFGEPAWDMLLDLHATRMSGKQITVTSACVAASVPTTTALRHLNQLIARGLVERFRDTDDQRRTFVAISDKGYAAMSNWVEKQQPRKHARD